MKPTAAVVRADLMSAPVDRDLVILNAESDNYVALDEIGRRIWDLIDEPRLVSDLCGELGKEFEGEDARIAADVEAFLLELEAEGLVRFVDGPHA